MRLKIDFSGGKINKINKVLDRQKKKKTQTTEIEIKQGTTPLIFQK